MREREREREVNALAYSLLQRVKKMMLHIDKKWINSFGWDKSFCVEKKENGGNGLTLATIATKLRRYLKMKRKIEIMLGNGLSMKLERELLSIGLIINFLDNGKDKLLVIIFWTNYKS